MTGAELVATMRRETARHDGTVPRGIGERTIDGAGYALVGEEFLLRTASGLGFHYRKGAGIAVERPAGSDPAEEALFFNGSVYAAVAAINGLWPFHASAVVVNDKVHAFTGPAGAGKSTLVAALGARGFPLFCDDTLILHLPPEGPALCLPGHKRLKLAPDALAMTGARGEERVAADLDKHYAAPPSGTDPRVLPLAEMVVLEADDPIAVAPVTGGARLAALDDDHYTRALMLAARRDDRAARFADLARLAAATRVTRFTRPFAADRFAAGADAMAAHLAGMVAQ